MTGRQSPRTIIRHIPAFAALLCLAIAPASSMAQAETEEQKLMYFLGVSVSRGLRDFALTPNEQSMVVEGLRDSLAGNAMELDAETYGPQLQSLAQERAAVALEQEQGASQKFLTEAAKAKGAVKTDSGLIYIETVAGNGAQPGPTDTVRVHYHGTLRDGSVFDSSVKRGQPAEFPLNRVIPCWTEGVPMLKVGGKARLICPSDIAYGDRGSPPNIPGGAALTFEVELLSIMP
jgi:FKBP-type peptidyl-prolyl cis-trans isomerase FkpA